MRIELTRERIDFLAKDYSRGFIKHCRFEAEVILRGYFQSRVKIGKQHRQQDGFIHAGVMATMADHTAGYAAFTTVSPRFIFPIQSHLKFPVKEVGLEL
jgi:acyl-coenzyme A thioesterase PaaI-like protein